MKNMVKRFFSAAIILCMLLSIVGPVERAKAYSYDPEAAMNYAEAHWNDGVGLCAEFVSRCVQAGGINAYSDGTGPLGRAIMREIGMEQNLLLLPELRLDGSGNATYAANKDILTRGDVVLQFCNTHQIAPHVLICAGYDDSGCALFYAHNGSLHRQRYNLGLNTAYQHTTACNMGGRVIHLSSSTPSAPSAPSAPVPVDVGAAFYAYIINNNTGAGSWRHIGTKDNNIELQDTAGSAGQLWLFERQSDKSYKITNCENGYCLDVSGAGGTGTNVQLYPSNDTPAQRWIITGESGNYQLHPACAPDCSLDVNGAHTEYGTNVQIWTTNGTGAQQMQVYVAESEIIPSTLSVSTDESTAYFKWNKSRYATKYNLRIFDSYGNDRTEWSLSDTSKTVALPAGSYRAYIDSCNQLFYQKSNEVTFTIEEKPAEAEPSVEPSTPATTAPNTSVPKMSIKSLKAASKGFTVTWNTKSDVEGYQVRYATNSFFISSKRVTVGPYHASKYTATKLKKNTTYYVSVRAYKIVNGEFYYGKWSSPKKVKTKR